MSWCTNPDPRHPHSCVLHLATIALLFFVQACSGPPLKPWHTEKLTEEFTAARADEVQSFVDYQQLEERLFRQLEEKVYAQVQTGPEYELVRYSAGSAADPQNKTPNWNRSFELTSEAPTGGVLLLHGMSDSPYSLRALAQTLNQRGYWVVGLRLPGHGTAPSGLKYLSPADMIAAVRLAMAHLDAALGGGPIHIVGYSTGAPLALNFALDAIEDTALPVPVSLVLISPAIRVHAAAGAARFKDGMSVVPGLKGLAWLQIQPEFDPYKYNSFATNAGDVVHQLTRSVDSRIAALDPSNPALPPILVFKSTVDATVTTEAVVDNLLAVLAPDRHELVLFDINRTAAKSTLLIDDPGPLTQRLMDDATLRFAVTFITKENPQSTAVVARHKDPFTADVSDIEPLDLAWPNGVISLSHVALPFPPDDPLYGRRPPDNDDILFLGELAMQGERGLLKIPDDWLLRLRYNPFYQVIETRVLEWFDTANAQPPRAD